MRLYGPILDIEIRFHSLYVAGKRGREGVGGVGDPLTWSFNRSTVNGNISNYRKRSRRRTSFKPSLIQISTFSSHDWRWWGSNISRTIATTNFLHTYLFLSTLVNKFCLIGPRGAVQKYHRLWCTGLERHEKRWRVIRDTKGMRCETRSWETRLRETGSWKTRPRRMRLWDHERWDEDKINNERYGEPFLWPG